MKTPTLNEYIQILDKKYFDSEITVYEYLSLTSSFASLFRQEPKASDFVPCDKDGNPIQKPKLHHSFDVHGEPIFHDKKFKIENEAYQTALSNVIFKGFEVIFVRCKDFKFQSEEIIFKIQEGIFITYNCYYKSFVVHTDLNTYPIHTLEQLIPFGVELSDEKKKEFKLL